MVSSSHVAVCVIAGLTYTIATIVVTYCLYKVLKNVCMTNNAETVDPVNTIKTKGYKMMIGCNVCGLISFEIGAFFSMLFIWIIVFSDGYYDNIWKLIYRPIWIFYLIGIWIMLFIFVSRIDHSFRDSFLAYSPFTINILYGCVYIIGILLLIVLIFNVLVLHRHIDVWLGPLALAIHFIFSVTLMCLLCKKVFQSMQLRMMQRMDGDDKGINDEEEQTKTKNKNIIDLNSIKSWTQYTMLVSIGIITTYIGNIVILAAIERPDPDVFTGDNNIPFSIDLTVNAICLYFLFKFNQEQYFKVCGSCHGLCEMCCVQCVYGCVSKDKFSHKTKEQCVQLILSE